MPHSTSKTSPLLIGHRGASAVAPENTLISFARAFADGAVGIELDVRLTRDGVPVVIHDANLRRTAFREVMVAEMSASELGGADAGSWFNRAHPQLARAEYTQQFVPALDQVLDLVKDYPRASVIYVEMKTDKSEDSYVDLSRAVVQLIQDHGLQSQVVVVSFNLKAVSQVKAIDGAIRTGVLFEPRRNPFKIIRKHPMINAALECGAEEILLHRSIASRRNVDLSLESDLLPVVWTVDDPKWVRRAASSGIHAVITNNPAGMLNVARVSGA